MRWSIQKSGRFLILNTDFSRAGGTPAVLSAIFCIGGGSKPPPYGLWLCSRQRYNRLAMGHKTKRYILCRKWGGKVKRYILCIVFGGDKSFFYKAFRTTTQVEHQIFGHEFCNQKFLALNLFERKFVNLKGIAPRIIFSDREAMS